MNDYAQTNIQLFNQLHRQGYPNHEIGRVFDAYEFAMHLFTGLFQPSGKPFIDHLISTASILASLHAPIEIVTAGLIHATYVHGDFGDRRKGASRAKREIVRHVVGEKVEGYVAGYAALNWDRKRALSIHNDLDALSPINREALLMRLANELEIRLDLAYLYFGDTTELGRRSLERYGFVLRDMADKLGFPTLATEFVQVYQETVSSEVPADLRSRSLQTGAYLIAPRSYRKQLSLAVWRRSRRELDRLRNFVSRRNVRRILSHYTGA